MRGVSSPNDKGQPPLAAQRTTVGCTELIAVSSVRTPHPQIPQPEDDLRPCNPLNDDQNGEQRDDPIVLIESERKQHPKDN
jgi:hypothetical protein